MIHQALWGIFPNKGMISRSMISWFLMKILSEIDYKKDSVVDWSIIKEYLYNDTNKHKCFQLSEKIANLFIQYFMYRRDWLFQWQYGEKIEKLDIYVQSWQSELWCLFLKEISNDENLYYYFSCNINNYIINFLEKNVVNLTKLPKRIFVYEVSSFPPVFLEILQALGKYVDIYIFCINPCLFFLKKEMNCENLIMVDSQNKLFNTFDEKVFLYNQSKKHSSNRNYLLSLWSETFQKKFYSLLYLDVIDEYGLFVENKKKSFLLHILQNDILNDYSKIDTSIIHVSKNIGMECDIKKRLLVNGDNSLSVHVCHSIQREIEVLHDNLLSMILNDSSLFPRDIVVMAPDINCYVSTIQSVFSYASVCGRYLPFSIVDYSVNNINMISSSFFKLLKMPYIRFTVQEVLEFLEIPSLAMRFGIDEEGVKLLDQLILESGIRWSLDDDMCSNFMMFPVFGAQYTWKFSLSRMLLSYAMDSTSPWNNVLPYDISGDNMLIIDLIGQLDQFLEKLTYWKKYLSKNYKLEEWIFLAEKIISDFYVSNFNSETESTLILLKSNWIDIISSGIKANYCSTVSVDLLCSKLYDRISKKKSINRFFSGGVTFCNLSSASSIPFKVVYILGMNVNYPSCKTLLNFNLMAQEERFYDDNSLSNDRYLFLKALLSARCKFCISFIGCSMINNKKYHSSILVYELFEYIMHSFYRVDENTEDLLPLTMSWIYENFWYWHARVPFSLENFVTGKKYQSFFKEWLFQVDNINKYSRNFFSSLSLFSTDTISLKDLYNFYWHPIRTWFQCRLKIYIPKRLHIFCDESFFVDVYTKYQICKDLIFSFLNNEEINILYQRVRYSGVLPYGNFGDMFWKKQCSKMMQLSQIISQYYFPEERYDLKIFIDCDYVQLTGTLSAVQKNGLLRWEPRVLYMKDGLLLWLEHLVYCIMGGNGDSWMFGIDSSWHFSHLSSKDAKEYLLFLISGYFQGMSTPLLLFSYSGGNWLRHCFDVKEKSISVDLNRQYEARRKLVLSWEENKYIYGENSDPYVKKLIPQLREEDIESIILAAKDYFLFPMKFNISHMSN